MRPAARAQEVGATEASRRQLGSSSIMGAIWFRTREFGGVLSESVGSKAGVALSEERMREFLADMDGYETVWPREDGMMRVRSEEYAEIHWYVLYRLGILAYPVEPTREQIVWEQIRDDPAKAAIFELVNAALDAFVLDVIRGKRERSPEELQRFIDSMAVAHGTPGAEIAESLVNASPTNGRDVDPFQSLGRSTWSDVRDLEELFHSERLRSPHGTYFDERFANFLAANFDAIDDIHWRQLEGLAAEHFKREGFDVELGPGRGDGGVDIRLRPQDASPNGPAAVLVQCKRQRTRISNTVVKALWADVAAEDAESGLIVTTSTLSPSARAVRTARSYAIDEAGRETLRTWVEEMRTPGTGMFLAE
jgi:restriction system protein